MRLPARLIGGILGVALLAAPAAADAAVPGDFNHDGRGDLAVGVPGADVNGVNQAGAVVVLYGSNDGLRGKNSQLFSPAKGNLGGDPNGGDRFGTAVAAGDVNGDGFDDLAVGGEGTDTVTFIFGSDSGLTKSDSEVADAAETTTSLSSGDFDDDGHADVAAGHGRGEGSVTVFYGSSDGVDKDRTQTFREGEGGLQPSPIHHPTLTYFGRELATGDLNKDGKDDLAVGAPSTSDATDVDYGHVVVLYGSGDGLTADGNQVFTRGSSGVGLHSSGGDSFGRGLAIASFDGGGADDLAIGAPEDTDFGRGMVIVLQGSSSGVTTDGARVLKQGSDGLAGKAEELDSWGGELAAGDFDDDGKGDLAVGNATETFSGKVDAGSVQVIYGSSSGLSGNRDRIFTQDTSGVAGKAERYDFFGGVLGSGDFDGDRAADLAVGVVGEGTSSRDDSGAVNVLYGSGKGITTNGDQLFNQDSPDVAGSTATDASFGAALAPRANP